MILPRKIKSSSFVEILESSEFLDRFRYLFPLLNVVVDKVDLTVSESLVDAIINFDVEIRSCFVNFRHEEFRVFTDALVSCLRQKVLSTPSKENPKKMRDADAERLVDELEAFGKFLDFLEEAMDDRLRAMEAKRWQWARLVDEKQKQFVEDERKKLIVEEDEKGESQRGKKDGRGDHERENVRKRDGNRKEHLLQQQQQ